MTGEGYDTIGDKLWYC